MSLRASFTCLQSSDCRNIDRYSSAALQLNTPPIVRASHVGKGLCLHIITCASLVIYGYAVSL